MVILWSRKGETAVSNLDYGDWFSIKSISSWNGLLKVSCALNSGDCGSLTWWSQRENSCTPWTKGWWIMISRLNIIDGTKWKICFLYFVIVYQYICWICCNELCSKECTVHNLSWCWFFIIQVDGPASLTWACIYDALFLCWTLLLQSHVSECLKNLVYLWWVMKVCVLVPPF